MKFDGEAKHTSWRCYRKRLVFFSYAFLCSIYEPDTTRNHTNHKTQQVLQHIQFKEVLLHPFYILNLCCTTFLAIIGDIKNQNFNFDYESVLLVDVIVKRLLISFLLSLARIGTRWKLNSVLHRWLRYHVQKKFKLVQKIKKIFEAMDTLLFNQALKLLTRKTIQRVVQILTIILNVILVFILSWASEILKQISSGSLWPLLSIN